MPAAPEAQCRPAKGSALAQAPQPKLQALIVTGQNGHDWRATAPVLKKLLEDTGRFEVRVTEEFRGAGAETLASYDVVVLNYYDGGKPALRWGDSSTSVNGQAVEVVSEVYLYFFLPY